MSHSNVDNADGCGAGLVRLSSGIPDCQVPVPDEWTAVSSFFKTTFLLVKSNFKTNLHPSIIFFFCPSLVPLPPRERLYNRYCSNKHNVVYSRGGGGGGGLFIFNDTIEGPRAPAVKPGRIAQVLKQE